MPWDPAQYEQFKAERYAPFDDCVRLVTIRPKMTAVDLGCGTGELTRKLADLLPESDVLGIDSSAEMLARAQTFVRPGLRFEQKTIERIERAEGQWDLVFSHAAIHWVDDHETLIPRLLSLVKPGGQLVVQEPSNHGHESHVLIRVVASEEPFRSELGGFTRKVPVLGIERYAELLHAHGGTKLTVMEKVYPHVLPDADALAEWTSGTALVPYFERLPREMHNLFMDRYRARLRERFEDKPLFYGFRRTIFAATRKED